MTFKSDWNWDTSEDKRRPRSQFSVPNTAMIRMSRAIFADKKPRSSHQVTKGGNNAAKTFCNLWKWGPHNPLRRSVRAEWFSHKVMNIWSRVLKSEAWSVRKPLYFLQSKSSLMKNLDMKIDEYVTRRISPKMETHWLGSISWQQNAPDC